MVERDGLIREDFNRHIQPIPYGHEGIEVPRTNDQHHSPVIGGKTIVRLRNTQLDEHIDQQTGCRTMSSDIFSNRPVFKRPLEQ